MCSADSGGNAGRERVSSRCLTTAEEGRVANETMEVVRRNWRAEVETAQTYRDLAVAEPDEKRQEFCCVWRKPRNGMRNAGNKS